MKAINSTVKEVIKYGEEKEIFETEEDRKLYKHHKEQMIQQKIKALTEQTIGIRKGSISR